MTVLVGPNNEGKSNILRALVAAMNVLTRGTLRQSHGTFPANRGPGGSRIYDWDTDFPIHLQEKQPTGQSVIHLDFRLSGEELQEFRTEVGSRIRENLPLRIAFGPREYTVSVHKKGPGGPALSKKQAKIADCVARRLDFQHIPAVRTAESAQQIVSALVSRELARLEGNDEYAHALRKIEELQQPSTSAQAAELIGTSGA